MEGRKGGVGRGKGGAGEGEGWSIGGKRVKGDPLT